MKRLLVLPAVALALAGCGAAERATGNSEPNVTDRVDVVLRPDGKAGQSLKKSLRCTAVTPDCERLRAADFDEPKRAACTQQYGGPATATVTGKAAGRPIDTTFELTNGCQIERWKRFSWLLGEPPAG